jgi:hypothetical protein
VCFDDVVDMPRHVPKPTLFQVVVAVVAVVGENSNLGSSII